MFYTFSTINVGTQGFFIGDYHWACENERIKIEKNQTLYSLFVISEDTFFFFILDKRTKINEEKFRKKNPHTDTIKYKGAKKLKRKTWNTSIDEINNRRKRKFPTESI